MASEREWPIGTAVVVVCLLFAVGLATVSESEVRRESALEAERIEREYGTQTLAKINRRADGWYMATLGAWNREVMGERMTVAPADGMRDVRRAEAVRSDPDGNPLMGWLDRRRSAFLDLGYWILRRAALFGILLPLWFPLMLLSIYHGWMNRAIKQTDFGYTSPVVNHWARSAMTFITVLTVLLFFSPVALYPWIFPLLTAFWSLAAGAAIGNIQKRI